MERDRLICCLLGKYTALQPNISPEDLRVKIDQHLIECQFTPLGTEHGDNDLLQDLLDETMFSVIGRGVNREMRRKVT